MATKTLALFYLPLFFRLVTLEIFSRRRASHLLLWRVIRFRICIHRPQRHMLFLPKRAQDSVRSPRTSTLGDLRHVPFLLSSRGLSLSSYHISKVCPMCPVQCCTPGSSSSQSRNGLFPGFLHWERIGPTL